jgi:hypothetical protein
MAAANNIGVTGTIQRYHHTDIILTFEGTLDQSRSFLIFLKECHQQGMFTHFRDSTQRGSLFRLYSDFSIIKDFSRTKENGGKVLKGRYSDDSEFDKQSDYSADSGVLLGRQRDDIF